VHRPSGGKVIESPHEPEARRGKKRDKTWLGYKAQVTETCDEDRPHLVVDLAPTGATENDAPVLAAIQARLTQQEILPGEQYVDQGYMSALNVVSSTEQGIELVGKFQADSHPRPGFQQADFQIDEAVQQVTCPADHTSISWRERRSSRDAEQRVIEVRFDGPTCRACAFFGRCTERPQGRTLELHPLRAIITARRQEAESQVFKDKLKLRAGIEGTISELVRVCGLRRARYRGTAKLGLQCWFTAVAVNLKRLMRWWAQAEAETQSEVPMMAAA
jgi:transposase